MYTIQRLFKLSLTFLLCMGWLCPSLTVLGEEESQVEEEEVSSIPAESQPTEESSQEEISEESESEIEEVESEEEEEEIIESVDIPEQHTPPLLDTAYLAFAQNRFPSEQEADAFIALIESDPASKDQFVIEKKREQLNTYVVTIDYKDTAKEDGPYILYYVSSEAATEAQADRFAIQSLHLLPDILFDYAVMSVNESMHDVILGIRPGAQAQALNYDDRTGRLTYEGIREEYTYEVSPNAEGLFEDPIQETITSITPDAYRFEEFQLPDGNLKVTMIPQNNTSTQVEINEEDRTSSPQVSILPIDEEQESKPPIQGQAYKETSTSSYMLGVILALSAILVGLMVWTSKHK